MSTIATCGQVNPADRILDIITKGGDSLYEAWAEHLEIVRQTPAGPTLSNGGSGGEELAKRFGFYSPPVQVHLYIYIPTYIHTYVHTPMYTWPFYLHTGPLYL
jgi:hypothetical protein